MKSRDEKQDDKRYQRKQRDDRSNKEQLDLLDERLGKGVGAKRERQRLLK